MCSYTAVIVLIISTYRTSKKIRGHERVKLLSFSMNTNETTNDLISAPVPRLLTAGLKISLQFLISSFVTLLINSILKRCPVIKGVELIQWRLSNVTVPRPPKLTHFSRVRDKGLGERSTEPPGALSSSPSLPRLTKIAPFPAQHQHHAAPPCPTLSHTECHCLPSDGPLPLHNATCTESLFFSFCPSFLFGTHRLCIFIERVWLGNV